jgi:type I restriction enzyme R subunit
VKATEGVFEQAICEWLVDLGGYQAVKIGTAQGSSPDFDAVAAVDAAELFSFIGATQADEWDKLKARYGGADEGAQSKFVKRLAAQLDARGTVDVLRHGVDDHGVKIHLAYFKAAHGLTDVLTERYEANRLTVTRQLPFDPKSTKTLDLCLFVNGLPVATAELKTHLTGQSVEHAKAQYRQDRDPKNTLLRRALVHFAVDTETVAMTTRLEGKSTRFLPFNQGHDLGPGNPPNPRGHRTAYLWERVWQRDAWLDLLNRFVHVEASATKRAAPLVIFPRFHQWDAVLTLEADAKTNGAGENYLVQHSAGSGKSNTIAWLAHRLSVLHSEADAKVFDKVVVITDRVVLNRQLQDTIYQFEHTHGVVERIESGSKQLAEALEGERARIIITTIQTFPFVLDKISATPGRRYAVIVDEAHSSQTGEAAKDLRLALGATDEQELTAAEAEDNGLVAEPVDPVEEAMAKAVSGRGRQGNLSFFAFTATPKAKTLELFGWLDPDSGRYVASHLYSMRQAIDEGFIHDVLANYTTYRTYWRIQKKVADDPAYDEVKARRAIARFVDLHPHNLAQKAEIVVEHFRTHTAKEIGGKAKAMVVTSSRLHAVRYKQALDRYIQEKGYADIAALVAFSGKVLADGVDHTESNMNGIPESQTVDQFDTDSYQVLVVAEKYQTGFDQPLLHTMFVDKTLTGLAAVQTLSRLNRTHPDKKDTFVLDFRNDAEAISEAFQPWYTATVAPPTDPNLLYDTRSALDPFGVLRAEEIQAVVAVLLAMSDIKDHGRIHAALAPAVDRFHALDDEAQADFADKLNRFVRTYAFLSQIVTFTDTGLERDYRYCRALAALVKAEPGGRLDLGAEVELTHLRHEIISEGSISLDPETGEVIQVFDGKGKQADPETVPLSSLVDTLNVRFGTNFTDADQLLFDQFEADWVANENLGDQARSNDLDNFALVFAREFMRTVVTRMDTNEDIYKRILDDQSLQDAVKNHYARSVYDQLRNAS